MSLLPLGFNLSSGSALPRGVSSIEAGARHNEPAKTAPMTEEDAVPIGIDILNRRETRFALGSPSGGLEKGMTARQPQWEENQYGMLYR